MRDACLVLTATVDPGATPFTARVDPAQRAQDYATALADWARHPTVHRIVFCENSGYDLSQFQAAIASRSDLTVEFLSAPVQAHPPERGKGFGEMAMLAYVARSSSLYQETRGMVKVTGRYTVTNWHNVATAMDALADVDVLCNLSRNLRWADSRAYYAVHSFTEQYLLPRMDAIDDSSGAYFEHVLARAVHSLLADAGHWRMWPVLPDVAGISGTENQRLKTSRARSAARQFLHRLTRRAIEK